MADAQAEYEAENKRSQTIEDQNTEINVFFVVILIK